MLHIGTYERQTNKPANSSPWS